MAQLFNGDFETGNTSQFTSASGSVQSSVVLHGTYAGKNTNNTNFLKTLSTAYSPLYLHGWFRWDTDPSTANNWFVFVASGEASDQLAVRLTSGSLNMYINANATYYYGSRVLSINTWYEIEVFYLTDSSAGSFEVRINGVTDIAKSGINTKNGTDTGVKTVKWQGINAVGNSYLDDASLNDTSWTYTKVTMRVSLPGYDCLTDGTIDHYSIYADTDNILIKEYARGSISVGTLATGTVAHNFGYPPMSMGFAKIISGTLNQYQWLYGNGYFNYYYSYSSTANVYFVNAGPFQTTAYKYYIFYDNQK